MQKFYGRKNELKILKDLEKRSRTSSQMSVIVGRRRTGKTRLIQKAFSKKKKVYLFVRKESEKILCQEFKEVIENELTIKIHGSFDKFSELFAYLVELSRHESFTLILDEFQEFFTVNKAVFSDMQNIWDKNKRKTKMNLVLSGSIYTLMKKIFENSKEPLFGRANRKIHLKPFNVKTLKKIVKENYPKYTNKDLLAFYVFTGGVAKYVETFVDEGVLTYNKMLKLIFSENSPFIEEGKNILIEEFGKEYVSYFSILGLIASSRTSRGEIESILNKNIGGYLDRLENEYNIIKSVKPVFSAIGSKKQKYFIEDNFLNFWFRFIYKNKSALEIGNFKYVKEIVQRDFTSFAGLFLERYFRNKLALSKKYSVIGSYWERGNQSEIDIVAVNKIDRKALVVEVKINENKISIPKLKSKATKLKQKYFKDYQIRYRGLSLEDM